VIVGTRHSCNKQQQATKTLPIAMKAIKAITNCDGRNQCHHHELPKRSRDKPLKPNKEGRGNQPQSHKVALPTNATKPSWGHCEYHDNNHPMITIILTGASIATTQAQRMQEGDTLWGKPQEDWANSCPRSPAMNVGSTTKQQKRTCRQNKKRTNNEAIVTLTPCIMRNNCLISRQIKSPDRASDTVPSDDRATTTKTTILLVIQK
jgi:hypothetical protein